LFYFDKNGLYFFERIVTAETEDNMHESFKDHTVKSYNDELAVINKLVLQQGNMGRTQLANAVQTLKNEDPREAGRVIDRDRDMNDLDVLADEEIIRIIAKRQPMAKDLRDIMMVQKTISDLERVGDEARKLANLTIHFFGQGSYPPNREVLSDIYKMANYVDGMLAKALDAFDTLDFDKALEVIQDNDNLYNEFRASLRRLSTFLMEDSRSVGPFVEVVLALRALERIGGHAKNIGGYVIFLITGKDVRHESLETIQSEIVANTLTK
jgi:phosphate transport system protein